MVVIPAMDLIEGNCVRLKQGDFAQKTAYTESPLEVAKKFEAHGLKKLHLVDLDGSRLGRPQQLFVLEQLASRTRLSIDYSGGLTSFDSVRAAIEAGARQVSIGTLAVKKLDEFLQILEVYGSSAIILSADVRDSKIAISGWTDQTELELNPFIRGYVERGVKNVICTDISKDGAMEGPNTDLYRQLVKEFPQISFIASGGVTSISDLESLQATGVAGAILGKAIYEGTISLTALKEFQDAN